MNFASKFCQAQQQPQLRLRLALFPADPTTHPSTVLVSKVNSGLYCDKVYFFKTISIPLHAQGYFDKTMKKIIERQALFPSSIWKKWFNPGQVSSHQSNFLEFRRK